MRNHRTRLGFATEYSFEFFIAVTIEPDRLSSLSLFYIYNNINKNLKSINHYLVDRDNRQRNLKTLMITVGAPRRSLLSSSCSKQLALLQSTVGVIINTIDRRVEISDTERVVTRIVIKSSSRYRKRRCECTFFF